MHEYIFEVSKDAEQLFSIRNGFRTRIIRCKDCKHYCSPNCFRLLDDNCTGVAIAMPENGFCSFGEGEENEK